MANDLRRTYGEEYLQRGEAHPITHTLDIAFGYWCTAGVAEHVGDKALAKQFYELAERWMNAYDPSTGLLKDSTFYEGTRHNYSFRILHDMESRIGLSGGEARFVEQLDTFFGYGAEPVRQPGLEPAAEELLAGYRLGRFEGLNNEPDMEVPWAYHWAGRPDRTAEIVHAAIHQQFGPGRGGLPGNDDSGGLSSWLVWASLGLFPIAGQNLVLLGPPAFERSTIAIADHTLVISADGFVEPSRSSAVQYVRSVTVDGVPLDRTWLHGEEFRQCRELRFLLGPEPSDWGRVTRPPSSTRRSATPPTASSAPPAAAEG